MFIDYLKNVKKKLNTKTYERIHDKMKFITNRKKTKIEIRIILEIFEGGESGKA